MGKIPERKMLSLRIRFWTDNMEPKQAYDSGYIDIMASEYRGLRQATKFFSNVHQIIPTIKTLLEKHEVTLYRKNARGDYVPVFGHEVK